MDMSADTSSIAARRVEMESIKPVVHKPRIPADERLAAHPGAEAGAINRRNDKKDSSGKKKAAHNDTRRYGSAGLTEGEDLPPVLPGDGEDSGEHVLDVRV